MHANTCIAEPVEAISNEEFLQRQFELFLDLANFSKDVHGANSPAYKRAEILCTTAESLLRRYQYLMESL